MQITQNELVTDISFASATTADINLDQIDQGSLQLVYVDKTSASIVIAPSAITVATKLVTKANHGLVTGAKVSGLSSATTLPAGWSNTTYYIIVLSANTFQLAASLADALAGTPVDPVDQGTGNHTIAFTALTTVSVEVHGSNDGTNYALLKNNMITDLKTAAISAAGHTLLPLVNQYYKYGRLVCACAGGTLGLKAYLFGKK